MNALAVKTKGVTKRFGDTLAVAGLDLSIPAGVFYGLLGPNGAGKSTSVGMLTGILRPSSGQIEILGRPLDMDDPWFKSQMGVVTETPALFSRLTGPEQLIFTGRMFALGRKEAIRRTEELIDLLGLSGHEHTRVVDYSRGMRKKLAIGCALIHGPRLLFFDEPFEGVDAMSAQTIRRVLQSLTGRGATVLLTTHILEVAESVCEQVGIIRRGRLVYEAQMATLHSKGERLAEVFRREVGAEDDCADLPSWLTDKLAAPP